MFKRVVTGIGAFLLISAPFSSAQAALLAKVEADVDGSGQKEIVELTGEKKMPGSNYYSDLWIMVKNGEGKMLTAWKANLDGGYYCLLEKMPVNAKGKQDNKKAKQKDRKEDAEKRFDNLLESLKEATGEGTDKEKSKTKISDKPHDQILLMAAKGGKNAAVNCRILDFSDYKQVQEVFSGADSLGVAAKAEYKPDNRFTVESSLPEADGAERTVSFSGNAKNVFRLYHDDGSIAKPYLVQPVELLRQRYRHADFPEKLLIPSDQDLLLGNLVPFQPLPESLVDLGIAPDHFIRAFAK